VLILAEGEAATDRPAPRAAPATPGGESMAASEAGLAPAQAAPAPEEGGEAVLASPVAKRLAREHGLDLSAIRGTGPRGRIVEADVRQALEAAVPAAKAESDRAAAPQLEALSGPRRVAAERMAHSFSTAPHFYLHVEADASALAGWYERRIAQPAGGDQPVLTYTDLLLYLCARALQDVPRANASWHESGRVQRNAQVNIGIAVATERGLVVPVVHGLNGMPLEEITRRRRALVDKALAGRLLPDEMAGGTFTLTNLGMFGIDSFNAILNPPQSAILAVGRIKPRPVVVEGQVAARPTLHLNLSADHRVLDGADAARFLGRLAELIEAPQQFLG
jgi:pyruvate dehydrogenase E2 component (dihydrolipoamide acetyltransferase)